MRRSFSSRPPLACGFAPMRCVALGREVAAAPARVRRFRRTAPRGGRTAQPLLDLADVLGGVRAGWAPDARASSPRPSDRRHMSGPVQPLGRAQDDHRPARTDAVLPFSRASAWIGEYLLDALVKRVGHERGAWPSGSLPSTKCGSQPQPRKKSSSSSCGDAGEDGGVGDLIAVQVQDGQHGAVGLGVDELVEVP